jgi:oligopeptide transport system ATP-binding protein
MKKETNTKEIVRVENLSVHFTRSNKLFKAVDSVSFDVKQGEVFGLIGESGSGKTTVAKTLIGLYDQSSGSIKIDNMIVPLKVSKINYKKRKELASKVQMIFQNPKSSLNPIKNVEQIISEGLINFNYIKVEHKKKIEELKEKIQKEEKILVKLNNPLKYHLNILNEEKKNSDDLLREEIKRQKQTVFTKSIIENEIKDLIKEQNDNKKYCKLITKKKNKKLSISENLFNTNRIIVEEKFNNYILINKEFQKQELEEIMLLKKNINEKKYNTQIKIAETKLKTQIDKFKEEILNEIGNPAFEGEEEKFKSLLSKVTKVSNSIPERLYHLEKFMKHCHSKNIISSKINTT